ncbi:MAG: amidohydrolase family protein [Bacteroidota bacterium]|nr:amidohydrolase family protein [Bacteroidota bacterium]MDP4233952.1 amidohydrolase family protein [Bacteroidota bacterium]MDP4242797.1 amidohydrolase family protein [Bacteroidota bacterium]MDP4288511.1 amidohydrolase family protein [Bacteroidota bacterium]
MMVYKILSVCFWVVLSPAITFCQHATLFKDVRVFDGLNVLPQTNVLIEGEKITKMGHGFDVPIGTDTIDGMGKTLLPGLIDAHAHVGGNALEDAIMAGVTTVLDMGGDSDRAIPQDGLSRADIFWAGQSINTNNLSNNARPVPPATMSDTVDLRLAHGSDYINIDDVCGTTGALKRNLLAIVEATHKRGRLVVAHLTCDARECIQAGIDGLICDPAALDSSVMRLARAHNVFVVPSLASLFWQSGGSNAELAFDSNIRAYLPQTSANNLARPFPGGGAAINYSDAERSTKSLQLAHVHVLAGTDAPNPGTAFGVSMHREMELLAKAGMTPVHALAAATGFVADAFHLGDRGHIHTGFRADLLLVNGDPTTTITDTRSIVGVWKRGHMLDRTAYLAKCAEQRHSTGMR